MTPNLHLQPVDHKEEKVLLEIGNSEKQLRTLIHSKGLLNAEAQDLYRKVRSSYERILLNNHTQSELQDLEYSLWKLHYKHIDEFRKIQKKGSGNAAGKKSGTSQDAAAENHLQSFKSFLSEAIEFYQTLIVKLRKHYAVPEEALFYKKGWTSTSVEPDVMLKCQYLCHRCLVCMGDLSRYKQQCENPDSQNHNWSVAATHYLVATRIWPDSGNPQNQLAVLATYIGDEFLAMYHSIRSLAVKEPFPDAWNNLILLFEKNRSSHMQYTSSEVCFDFLRSLGRISEETKEQYKGDSPNYSKFEGESNHFADTKLWSLMVRTISFLFITSSLEEFPIALASTVVELDKLMELEDIELKNMLESYRQMDLARRGPFRALQVVSMLIFSLKNLLDKLEKNESEDKNDKHLMQLALAAAFSFMGRFTERCLKASSLNHCPLLPSVLVFVEWCSSTLDSAEACATDQTSKRAISYFFHVFVQLLNQLNVNRKKTKKLLDNTPLWEDYELRGFVPVSPSHFSLDFSGNWEHIDNFESGIELRTERIRVAGMKIARRSNNLQKWITCDESGNKFYVASSDEDHSKKGTEKVETGSNSTSDKHLNQQINKDAAAEQGKLIAKDSLSSSGSNGKSSAVEEEEVILFRPLTRYNSAPSYPSISTDEQTSPKDKDEQNTSSDDCLRRATSLLMAQNPAQNDPWEFHATLSNFRSDKSFKQQEPSTKESNAYTSSEAPISAGPPSLSAWVLDRGSFSINRNNGTNCLAQHRLQPIDEIATSSLASISINNKTENPVTTILANESSNFHPSSATYSVPNPMPSAPLLPDNAAWFTNLQSGSQVYPSNQSPPPPPSAYQDWSSAYGPPGYDPRFPAFTNGYTPPGRMTSSEWLRWYRESYKPEKANNYVQPTHMNTPGPGNHGNLLYHENYRFNQFDRWGNPIPLPSNQYTNMEPPGPPPLQPGFLTSAYGASEQKASLFNNFQRPSPYGCGAVTDMRNEPQSLLEYLKEKELRLQRDPNLGGPTFMGNQNSFI
ncbi:hypothetical protein S245_032132 [Arachis hypogaea]|uniref:Protein SMG7L n=1 Tax=Arachis hypogaea TaxID=3818 RepID=A0A445BBH3_ARAHY|nr:Protein SMG7L [Arachis hypogaea]RYR36033.1 hypothetical protein Ahy_A10g051093 isoform A [Arachis hypogaea]RYR36034.1 hypothetical protein Ahy_A10g051093 isoform B [Arachis hypogaea]